MADLRSQIAGGVYFDEFKDMSKHSAGSGAFVGYAVGILLNVVGLSQLAPAGTPPAADVAEAAVREVDPHASEASVTPQLDGVSGSVGGTSSTGGAGSSMNGHGKPEEAKGRPRALSKRRSLAQNISMPIARMRRAKDARQATDAPSEADGAGWSVGGLLRKLGMDHGGGASEARSSPRSPSGVEVATARP
jgi:hypothetical protein